MQPSPPERARGVRARRIDLSVVASHGRNKDGRSLLWPIEDVLYRPRPDKPFLVSFIHRPTLRALALCGLEGARHELASQVANQHLAALNEPSRPNHGRKATYRWLAEIDLPLPTSLLKLLPVEQ